MRLCAVPTCQNDTRPGWPMCGTHWMQVRSDVRRAYLKAIGRDQQQRALRKALGDVEEAAAMTSKANSMSFYASIGRAIKGGDP